MLKHWVSPIFLVFKEAIVTATFQSPEDLLQCNLSFSYGGEDKRHINYSGKTQENLSRGQKDQREGRGDGEGGVSSVNIVYIMYNEHYVLQ